MLLRTLSTAICASDVHFMDHPELAVDDPTGRSLYDADRDIVLGHEFVGEVIGHGPGCTDQFVVGSRVTAMPVRLLDGGAGGMRIIGQHPEAQGSFGELLVVSEAAAKPVPGDVSSDAVALTDAFAVGEFYVRSAQIQPGEIAVVIGAGAIGLSAVAGWPAGVSNRSSWPTTSPTAARWPVIASAHTLWSIPPRSRRSMRSGGSRERGLPCPAVVFECVGAAGLIQNIVESAEMATRIYCAGGWYTGETLDITTATRQGVTILFGGGPCPRTGTEPSTPSRRDGWTRCRASARSSVSTKSRVRSIWPAGPTAHRASWFIRTETSHDRT